MRKKNRILLVILSIITIVLVTCSIYRYKSGVNSSFYIYNNFTEKGLLLLPKGNLSDPSYWNKREELRNKDPLQIDVLILVNGNIVFQDFFPKDKNELSTFSEKLNFGINIIEVYSKALDLHVKLVTYQYFQRDYYIYADSNIKYYNEGKHINLDEIEKKIISGEIEDYSLEGHEAKFFKGFIIEWSNSFEL